MSNLPSAATKLSSLELAPPTPCNNPFDSLFDGEETEDEWWNDHDRVQDSFNNEASAIRTTQWPRPPETNVLNPKMANRMSIRKVDKRYSVQKLSRDKSRQRQKKQNAKAGIKLVTNFTQRKAGPPIQEDARRAGPQAGCFVDLAALQALNGSSIQESSFWKPKKNKEHGISSSALASDNSHIPASEHPKKKNRGLIPSPLKLNNDLSPNDRPIVIGLSIPSADLEQHSLSPQTAVSDTTKILRSYEHRTPTGVSPETPTIIITPAQDVSIWSKLDYSPPEHTRPAPSVYSQAPCINGKACTDEDAPPVPQMPEFVLQDEKERLAGLKSCFSPDSDDATNWEDDERTPSRPRSLSNGTLFEEDENPILARAGRARSLSSSSGLARQASTNTISNSRRSKGWWNYITTPFLTRSSTFVTKQPSNQSLPTLPSLAIAAARVNDSHRDEKLWQKEFSPLTPQTTTSIASDPWWNLDPKEQKVAGKSPVLQDTRHKVEASTGTLPIILSEAATLGTASKSDTVFGDMSQLSREDTSSTFKTRRTSGFSPSDREVPMIFDSPEPGRLPSSNPFDYAPTTFSSNASSHAQSISRQVVQPLQTTAPQGISSSSPGEVPPPPYSPSPARSRKYRPVFPPGHALGNQYPTSPAPISPGLHNAMTSQGAIPMSSVPLTPNARRPINLNSGYPVSIPPQGSGRFFTSENLQSTSKKAQKAEAKRQRYEKEESAARKAGGLWRGRGCIPGTGCYGRGGAEGRKKRRWWIALIVGFLSMIILIVVLATQLSRKSNTVNEPSQWLNLTGFPPIYAGLSTVATPVNIKTNTGCVFPATQWSCSLPKELQDGAVSGKADQPNFLLKIQWDNSTETNATFSNVTSITTPTARSVGGNAVSAGQFMRRLLIKARQVITFVPSPIPPNLAEQEFLGNTTDDISSDNKAGEPTPFYISFLDTTKDDLAKRNPSQLSGRQDSSDDFPDVKSIIPKPSLNSDGSAASANLLPFPNQQPIRLYDRGLSTEHYGFYTYYDRSIFLKSVSRLNETNSEDGEVPDDLNGGATESEANFRCTWSQTRFLVQIWTRMEKSAHLLNSARTVSSQQGRNPATAAPDFTQPGTFPYPITVTVDRHGGDPATKMLYCYEMDDRRGLKEDTGELFSENRGFGGTLINKAPSFFVNASDSTLGGFDGGDGGCGCQWNNFQQTF